MNSIGAIEAFELLGLKPDCTRLELQKAYRKLARETHPDTAQGQSEAQARLNEAREVAAAYIADRTAIIPANVESAIHEFERRLIAEQAARQAQDIVAQALRRRTRRFRFPKYMAFVLAAGAGAVAWLRENVVPGIFGQVLPEMSDILRDELRLIAVVLAAMGGILHFLSQRNALLLESYKEDLDDVDACAEELAALLDYEDKSEIRQGSLAGFYVRPYRDPFLGRLLTLLRMDPVDRIRLLTAKGLEHGLLENVGPKNVLPASDRRLKITFKPSRFMPVPTPPPTPVPPLPPTVASVMLALCLAAGSGLALLAHLIATAWAYVPGAFSVLFFLASLGCVGALAEGILEAKKEKARGNRGEQAG